MSSGFTISYFCGSFRNLLLGVIKTRLVLLVVVAISKIFKLVFSTADLINIKKYLITALIREIDCKEYQNYLSMVNIKSLYIINHYIFMCYKYHCRINPIYISGATRNIVKKVVIEIRSKSKTNLKVVTRWLRRFWKEVTSRVFLP